MQSDFRLCGEMKPSNLPQFNFSKKGLEAFMSIVAFELL